MNTRTLVEVLRVVPAITISSALVGQATLREWRSPQIPPDTYFGGVTGSVAANGDIDRDGWLDVAIGEPHVGGSGFYRYGQIHIYSGRTGLQVRTIPGDPNRFAFGSNLSALADLDGDGIEDFASWNADLDTYIWVAVSGASGAVIRVWRDCTWLTRAHDADADGVDDVIVCNSNWWDRVTGNRLGRAELRSGRTDALIHTFTGGPSSWDLLGGAVPVGDVNGDGTPDICFAFPGDWSQYIPAFGFAVYSGRAPYPLIMRQQSWFGGNTFGMTVVGPGDMDADGYADIAVYDYGDRMSSSGVSYTAVFSGRTGVPIRYFGQPFNNDQFRCWSAPGDVDGDGHADLAGLLPGLCVRSGRDGSVLVELPPSETIDPRSGSVEGMPVAAGDLDGDDIPDLLVGNFDPSWLGPYRRVRAWSLRDEDVTVTGRGCSAGGTTPPRIGATRSPEISRSFEVHVSRTEANRSAVLFVGLSSTSFGGTPLPFDLSRFGFPGCSLLVSIDAMIEVTTTGQPGNGHATTLLPIPNDPALQAMRFHLQWALVESAGLSLTRALTCTIR